MKVTWPKKFLAALVFLGLSIYSCNQATDKSAEATNGDGVLLPNGTVFTRASLLTAWGECIVSEVENFEEQSRAFAATAAASITDPSEQDSVKQAWKRTIDAWQELEVMQVGPAAMSTQPGGQGWREAIYAWPVHTHCPLDRNLVSEAYTNPTEVKFTENGLWATEYLLFYSGGDNTCALDDEINSSGSWNALDDDTLSLRRARYASFTAKTVATAAAGLLNAWAPTGENFLAELAQAGDGSRTYRKKRVAINAVSDALFYVEGITKDRKLARPLGIIDCEQEYCTELVESKYGRRSKEHLRNNLLGFRKLFTGCGKDNEGLGFDDLLFAMGHTDLAEEINQAALATLDAIDAIDAADLVTALEEDRQGVLEVHNALSELTDLLRSEFLAALSLEIPQMVQGDND